MRRYASLLLSLLVAALLGIGWYAYQKGFTRKWRGFISGEFRKRGVEVSLRQLALNPFRGLVARDVKIYDTHDRRRTVAVIDEMLLVINYANLLKKEPFLQALDLREARLALPLDPKDSHGSAIEVSRLSGRLLLPPQQIYLSRLDAEVYGVHVSASGRLINPQSFGFAPDVSGERPLIAVAERVIAELKALTFQRSPKLELRFSGNIAEPKKIFVEGTLEGKRISRGSYVIEEFRLAGAFRDGKLELQSLSARDAKGTLEASGRWEPASKQGTLRMRSSLNALACVEAFGFSGPWADCVIYGAPQLEFTAKTNPDGVFGFVAHLNVPRFAYRSAVFESLAGDFSWEDGRWSARDLHLLHRTGEVRGDVMQVPGDFRARLHSQLNPRAFGPIWSGEFAEALAQFDFTDSPTIDFEVAGTEPKPEACQITAKLQLGHSSFRGVAAKSLVADIAYKNGQLVIAPFQLERAEGNASGGVSIDFAHQQVALEKIQANVFPKEVMAWFAPNLVKDVAPYRFPHKPPHLEIDGTIGLTESIGTRLGIQVEAVGGMDYTFLKHNLSSPHASGNLLFADRRLQISELNADLFGGRLRGVADISLAGAKPGHNVELRLENVDFASVTKLFFNYENSKGRFDAFYNFSGAGEDAKAMKGRGEIAVRDGNIFAIPFLGPFSGILNGIVPGMGHDIAHKASSSFSIADGVISTENLVVAGNGFSMLGSGKLNFVEDAMDFSVRINARGLPGVLLFPVSKLFEYVSDEKLSKPKWRAKALPRL